MTTRMGGNPGICPVSTNQAEATQCAQLRALRERERRALLGIARILTEESGQDQVLLEIIDLVEQALSIRHVTVMLLSTCGQRLELEATRFRETRDPAQMTYRRGEGVIGEVVATGQPRIVPRIADEPRFRNRIHDRSEEDLERLAFVCVPVLVDSETVGTLSADVCPLEPISPLSVQEFLSLVAAMISYDVKARRLRYHERRLLEAENLRLRDALGERLGPSNMIGDSKPMREVYQRIAQVAGADTTVLIRGESGTGKELVASAIHYSSPRARQRFVKVNCAALNEHLLESELFGHEKGAFTGAMQRRVGRIEEAEGGTLFLDEIGDFSPAVQVKLLRVIQEREFERVGSNETQHCDVRIVAATNRDLEQAVRQGQFRQDLYYRINVFSICLPALRKHRDDVLLLANHFVAKYAARMHRPVHRLSTPAINALLMYHWPGNVRELENCIEHAVLLSTDGVIYSHHLPPTLRLPEDVDETSLGTLETRVRALEADMISDALKRCEGNVAAAARELGITPRMARYKIRKLGITYDRGLDA